MEWSSAAGNEGGFKPSPLFKQALNSALERLEGKAEANGSGSNGVEINTSKPGCVGPDAPVTAVEVCETSEETCEGEYTCYGWWTCQATNTCWSTCLNTCSQNTCSSTCPSTCPSTCANTCVGGSCRNYHFYGVVSWKCIHYSGRCWYGWPYCGYPNGLPHDLWVDSTWMGLKWNDEGSERFWDPGWDAEDGEYDKTYTRTTTTAGYKLRAHVRIIIGECCKNWFVVEASITRTTQLENRN
ncbi:MAG: hypothetical protein ONB05_12460, partial [candidate division KSB1 bacterium]|nr:hypothetical protein [candidate division KSB1 bacterium]